MSLPMNSQAEPSTLPGFESKVTRTLETYLGSADRFVTKPPASANAYQLQPGAWKFDFDKMTEAEIRERIATLTSAQVCADRVGPGNFRDLDILELGPSDGYNTAALEWLEPRSITSIEGNAGAFMRCLILKNDLDLKAKFLLGDFIEYMNRPGTHTDVLFASGILYHLVDPAAFLARAGEIADHIFMWTFVYDAKIISEHHYEKHWFSKSDETSRTIFGRDYTYHRRYYQTEIVEGAKFAGGLQPYANWLTEADILDLLDRAGFDVSLNYVNEFSGIPARSIVASKRQLRKSEGRTRV